MNDHGSMADVRIFDEEEALADALAPVIMSGIELAREHGRRYLLGCPGGRTARPVYRSLARLTQGAQLGHLVIVMMDEYLEPAMDGGYRHASPTAHHSCARFAREEIVAPLNAAAATPVPTDAIWLPDPAQPDAYEARIMAAGGVDLFIVASGASDGHVAFLPPGAPLDGGCQVVRLAQTTRRDNLATFPMFRSIDDVPTHGVSVGLGTIIRCSRRVVLVMTGVGKHRSAERVLGASSHDPAWPATFIHECADAGIWLDAAAHTGGLTEAVHPGDPRGSGTEEVI